MYLCKSIGDTDSLPSTIYRTKQMNIKNIILSITLLFLGTSNMAWANTPGNTTTPAASGNIYWTDGAGRVTYSINTTVSNVVSIALKMFSNDMMAITGLPARTKSGANIQIFQLDQLTNKEFAALEKLGTPLHQFITKKEAFYMGTRKGKLIVVGSDARGTAYAIMELSRLAGVSPWIDCNDVRPKPTNTLYVKTGFESLQSPSIEYRGLALNSSKWMNPKNYSNLCRLMLRLRANTLWQHDSKHELAYDKAVVDSFDIYVGVNGKVQELSGKKHKKHHKKSIGQVKMLWEDPQLAFSNMSPGIILKELTANNESKASHDEKDEAWIANVKNPKMAPYRLSLFMEMAWNTQSVRPSNLENHLSAWLTNQFGNNAGKVLFPIMKEYFRLTNIRESEYMTMPFGDNEFHSGEFGNELERYLYAYDVLKQQVDQAERTIPAYQKDGFFETIKFPVYAAALIAEKELEAQEARHIARPGLFLKDDEAKAAAALSLNAYQELQQLIARYQNIGRGKWRGIISSADLSVLPPTLPGALSSKEVVRYLRDAFNRSEELKPLSSQTQDVIAKNAYEWNKTSGSGIELIPFLGHSNKVVELPRGASLRYTFYSDKEGDARFTVAGIPNYDNTKGNMRISIRIDNGEPVVCSLKEAYGSKAWKLNIWRGQSLKSFYTTLSYGNHTIEIKALDDQVMIDQWILDFDVDREYYMIPKE